MDALYEAKEWVKELQAWREVSRALTESEQRNTDLCRQDAVMFAAIAQAEAFNRIATALETLAGTVDVSIRALVVRQAEK